MELVEVEGVDALLSAHEDVLVPGVWVDPAGGAVDLQRTPVEHLGEAGAHVDLGGRWKPVGSSFGRRGGSLLRRCSVSSPRRRVRRRAPILARLRPGLVRAAVRQRPVSAARRA